MAYIVSLKSAGSDGTNIYTEIQVSDGSRTFPLLRPIFPVGTAASAIQAYMQAIANNSPTIASDIQELINQRIIGA